MDYELGIVSGCAVKSMQAILKAEIYIRKTSFHERIIAKDWNLSIGNLKK
jgi:hypothetical protein